MKNGLISVLPISVDTCSFSLFHAYAFNANFMFSSAIMLRNAACLVL